MGAVEYLRTYFPGFLTLVAGAIVAYAAASVSPLLNPLVVAVVVGVIVGNTIGVPQWAAPGVDLRRLFLETGIVLLGASIAVSELLAAGPRLALIVCATVAFGVVLVELLGRVVFRLTGHLPSLLAAGSSICGVSAVAAIGRVIGAKDSYLALAAATVLLFDALTLVAFPIAGSALGLSSIEFGIWAGLSMFSTGPVAAAGFAHSPEAGQWATITKLARNSLLGVVAIGYSAIYARKYADTTVSANDPSVARLWSDFPKFLVGFILVAVIANVGVLSPASIDSLGTVTNWLFILAFVGLGTSIQARTMRAAGATPILLVLVYLLCVSAVSLVAVRLLF